MNNKPCQKCQEFLQTAPTDNKQCKKYVCQQCGSITFLTFRHSPPPKPKDLMILTERQYQDLVNSTQHLTSATAKENIQKVLEEIKRDNH